MRQAENHAGAQAGVSSKNCAELPWTSGAARSRQGARRCRDADATRRAWAEMSRSTHSTHHACHVRDQSGVCGAVNLPAAKVIV
jgi:hypothetical protein